LRQNFGITRVCHSPVLLYGVLRSWLSRDWRREIEEEIGEEPVKTVE
jgi:hypothetical protein